MNDKNGTHSLGRVGVTRNGDLTRRKLIKAGGATIAATALFSGFPAPWVRAAKPAKIGYVTPQTGPLAPFAEADNFIVGSVREVFKKHDLRSRSSSRTVKQTRTAQPRSPPILS
jgi:hypothetical protein